MSHLVQQLKAIRLPACRLASVAAASLGAFIFGAVASSAAPVAAPLASPDYAVVDPEVRLERLDSSPNESFLSMRGDTTGRLFVGGREALFVYESTGDGRFAPRRELVRFPPNSWVYDVDFRGNDLYVLTLSALYVIPDGVVKREGLRPQKLLWGVPLYHVHQCFHALAWGPEGDLYISMGDTLVHYGDFDRADHWGHWTFFTPTQPEGIPYTGQGAILRMHPDGSGLRSHRPRAPQSVRSGLRSELESLQQRQRSRVAAARVRARSADSCRAAGRFRLAAGLDAAHDA